MAVMALHWTRGPASTDCISLATTSHLLQSVKSREHEQTTIEVKAGGIGFGLPDRFPRVDPLRQVRAIEQAASKQCLLADYAFSFGCGPDHSLHDAEQ